MRLVIGISKAYVRGHYRTLENGHRVYVNPHTDGRVQRSEIDHPAQLRLFQELTASGDQAPAVVPALPLSPPAPVEIDEGIGERLSAVNDDPPEPKPPIILRERQSFRVADVAIRSSKDAADLLDFLRDETREKFYAIALDDQGRALHAAMLSTGSLSASIVHPREAFQPAVVAGARRVIFAHNHPSGDATPSPEDIAVTRKLRKVGAELGIEVTDSIVIGGPGQHASIHATYPGEGLTGYRATDAAGPGDIPDVEAQRTMRPTGSGPLIGTPEDVVRYARQSMSFAPGTWGVLSIDTKGRLGQLTFIADPMDSGSGLRDILRTAILTSAASVIVVKPNYEGAGADDRAVAATVMAGKLQAAAEASGVPVSDVVSLAREGPGFTSYQASRVVKAIGVRLVLGVAQRAAAEHVITDSESGLSIRVSGRGGP